MMQLVLASPDLQMCIQSHVMRHQPPPPPPVSVIDEVTPVIEKAFQDTQALTKSRISELEGVMVRNHHQPFCVKCVDVC